MAIRVPVSRREIVDHLLDRWRKDHGGEHRVLPGHLRRMSSRVSAGTPRHSGEGEDESVDLFQHLVRHPESTYLLLVSGWSMRDAGIADGDELVVDRAVDPSPGDVVVAMIDGEATVKRLNRDERGRPVLRANNPEYTDIRLSERNDVQLLGVVTRVLHRP